MKRAVLAIIFLICVVSLAYAQSVDKTVTFEVASIKPSGPPEPRPTSDGRGTMMFSGCNGGPGSTTPGRFVCENATLSTIVANAYGLKPYQHSLPAWMRSTYFNVSAKLPENATKEQFQQMKQNLLAERFKLAAHFEKKEFEIYELTTGKDGPKFKETPQGPPEAASTEPFDPSKVKRDGEGMPVLPVRRGGIGMVGMNGPNGMLMRMQASDIGMEQLVSQLSSLLNKPVTDATGLKGRYDITLTCAPPDGSPMRMMPGPNAVDSGPAPSVPPRPTPAQRFSRPFSSS
jgi:uncharacterized protein (TIGR03435 family)